MKNLFFLFILLPFLSVAQIDTTLSEDGSITSVNETGINTLVNKNVKNKLKIILTVVSENPKILNVTSLQLTFFCCNCLSISSLDKPTDSF